MKEIQESVVTGVKWRKWPESMTKERKNNAVTCWWEICNMQGAVVSFHWEMWRSSVTLWRSFSGGVGVCVKVWLEWAQEIRRWDIGGNKHRKIFLGVLQWSCVEKWGNVVSWWRCFYEKCYGIFICWWEWLPRNMNAIVAGRGEMGDIGRVNGFPWLTNSRLGWAPSQSDQTLVKKHT